MSVTATLHLVVVCADEHSLNRTIANFREERILPGHEWY